MQRMLIHGEGDLFGQRLTLQPWHKEFLWRWYEVDPGDPLRWWYLESLIGAERGAVKTEFFAGIALLEMAGPEEFRRTTPIIHMAAGSYEQAGELFAQAQTMAGGTKDAPVDAAPLAGLFDVFEKEILYADGRPGRIQRIAAAAGTAEGGKTSLFLADEVHEWTGRKERVYTVVSAALSKRKPPGRTCAMTTAGAGLGSLPALDSDPLVWRLYARGLLTANAPGSRQLFDWVEVKPDEIKRDDVDSLRAALMRMRGADRTWEVDERIRDIRTRKLPWNEVLRYYFNTFYALGTDSWLLEIPECWEGCATEDAVPADGSEVVVGVDMSLHRDSVGVIVAGLLPDGRVGWWPRHWSPAGGQKIDHAEVFETIVGIIAKRWSVRAVTYDPRYFELAARMLEDHGILAVEFNQSPERLQPADGLVFDLVKDGGLAHPDDPVLNAHVANGAWREGERGRFFSKGKAGGHMDLLRAGAMATWELAAGEPEAEEFFGMAAR